jgi:hypothetical protein
MAPKASPEYSVKILDRLALQFTGAATRFAKMASQLEDSVTTLPNPNAGEKEKHEYTVLQNELIQLSSSAVIMAVAAWEANINERLQSAHHKRETYSPSDNFVIGPSFGKELSHEAISKWADLWEEELNRKSTLNPLEKTNRALELAGVERLPLGQGSAQDFELLLDLRNTLVHMKPVFRRHGTAVPQKDRDQLESRLRSRFSPSKIAPVHEPYLWKQCLGAGCARWAVLTVDDLWNDVNKRLGIPITVVSPF